MILGVGYSIGNLGIRYTSEYKDAGGWGVLLALELTVLNRFVLAGNSRFKLNI